MNFMLSILYGSVIIPTDELIFFRGVGIPPTSNVYDICVIGYTLIISNSWNYGFPEKYGRTAVSPHSGGFGFSLPRWTHF